MTFWETASPRGDQAPCFEKYEGQTQLLMATTTSTNASALRASSLMARRIAKANKLFTIGEVLILPAVK